MSSKSGDQILVWVRYRKGIPLNFDEVVLICCISLDLYLYWSLASKHYLIFEKIKQTKEGNLWFFFKTSSCLLMHITFWWSINGFMSIYIEKACNLDLGCDWEQFWFSSWHHWFELLLFGLPWLSTQHGKNLQYEKWEIIENIYVSLFTLSGVLNWSYLFFPLFWLIF